jgi:bifunctional DNA-binding transcriptional regulator/antitoxin component of YhaV-PrlF toxin-antitoxin module
VIPIILRRENKLKTLKGGDEIELFVIDYKTKTIKEFKSNFDVCDFLNNMQEDKKNYEEKRYLFAPSEEAAFYILTGGEELPKTEH